MSVWEGRSAEIPGRVWEQERLQQRVLRALRLVAGLEGEAALVLEPGDVRTAWHRAKGLFKGAGGYREYHQVIAALMIGGELEGSVDLEVGDWWEEVWTAGGRSGTGRQEAAQVTAFQRVVVDFGAGTQCARVLLQAGDLYVPLDTVRWVYSRKEGMMVENLVMDLSLGRAEDRWSQIRVLVLEQLGVDLGAQPSSSVLLWMSPPCKTFSRADSSNRNRGCGYRDHRHRSGTRPPMRVKGRLTVHGKLAAAHDRMVALWLEVAWVWQLRGARWAMENPVGSLVRRPYMRAVDRYLRQVDYCAYGRDDMKPTNIWTSVSGWNPKGTTGNGKCMGKGRCPAMQGAKHKRSVTGGRKVKAVGQGARAAKSAVPEMLLVEWGQAEQEWNGVE